MKPMAVIRVRTGEGAVTMLKGVGALVLVGLLALANAGYWVVRGYNYPPHLVAGPFPSWGACNEYAMTLNRIELKSTYNCQQYW